MAEQATSEQVESIARPADVFEPVRDLVCDLRVELSIPGFCVCDLVQLRKELVIDTRWRLGRDVPVLVNGQLVAWSEFEVAAGRLAVRLTELA